jgi:hypothetical protein
MAQQRTTFSNDSSGRENMHHRLPQWRYYWCHLLIITVGVVGIALGHSARTTQASETPKSSLQAGMQQIFQALTTVFPLSLSETTFQAPEHRQTIRTALTTLATQATQLEQHGRGSIPAFDFLRRALISDAQDVLRRFDHGEYEAAQFILHRLTDNCFACHAKLPPPQHSRLGERFMASSQIASLSLQERARLAVATRQFDTALTLYETLFQATITSASDIGLRGAFEEYLLVAIRVQDDVMRPIIALQKFLQRPDVPPFLRQQLLDWLDAFHGLASTEPDGETLSRARTLIQVGQRRNRFPADRRGLVHFVVASGLLHRYLDAHQADPTQVAEAYYLLGITESYVSRTLWHAQTEFFLETAIRSAPTSSYAREAFAFLENYLITRYTGSSGLHLPPEVQRHLTELRQVVEGH